MDYYRPKNVLLQQRYKRLSLSDEFKIMSLSKKLEIIDSKNFYNSIIIEKVDENYLKTRNERKRIDYVIKKELDRVNIIYGANNRPQFINILPLDRKNASTTSTKHPIVIKLYTELDSYKKIIFDRWLSGLMREFRIKKLYTWEPTKAGGGFAPDLKTGVNWIYDNTINVEIELSILTRAGKRYYYVHPWSGNTQMSCKNNVKGAGYIRIDGGEYKEIASIHTHNTGYINNPRQYDGPSFADFIYSKKNKVPVFTIGPNTVSEVDFKTWYIITEQKIKDLHKFNPKNMYPAENPFQLNTSISNFLDNPSRFMENN